MSDARLAWDHDEQTADLVLRPDGTLAGGADLETAVLISLATDRTAEAGDELPGFDGDRRGWWGDFDAGIVWGGRPLGSKLWLLARAKMRAVDGTPVEVLAEQHIRDALAWVTEDGVASQVDVEVERLGHDGIAARVRVWRGPEVAVDLRYERLWDQIGG